MREHKRVCRWKKDERAELMDADGASI